AVGTAVVYWLGGQLVISSAITLGTLVALAAYVTRIYTPLTSLTNARGDIMTALVPVDWVFGGVGTPNPIEDRPGAFDLVHPPGRVVFDDVWFHYPRGNDGAPASLELVPPPSGHGHGHDDDASLPDGNGSAAAPAEPIDVLRGVSLTID